MSVSYAHKHEWMFVEFRWTYPPAKKMPSENFRARFTGHETFPLRQLWLAKYTQYQQDLLCSGQTEFPNTKDAIVELGVGKNMVSAMRFWAETAGISKPNSLELMPLGEMIFGNGSRAGSCRGLDENCEHDATQWLVHWKLSSVPEAFTGSWFLFNCVNSTTSDRESLLKSLKAFCAEKEIKASDATLKRCIDVVLRSYLPKQTGKGHMEDFIEPLLAELDLLTPISRDAFEFHRSAHPSLPDGIFAFALMEYWERLPNAGATLDFNRIAFDYGSPGRVFKLDPKSVDMRLNRLETLTDSRLVWSEQAGLRQVVRSREALLKPEAFKAVLLKKAYAE